MIQMAMEGGLFVPVKPNYRSITKQVEKQNSV